MLILNSNSKSKSNKKSQKALKSQPVEMKKILVELGVYQKLLEFLVFWLRYDAPKRFLMLTIKNDTNFSK